MKVFSVFSGLGGSSVGYKRVGLDVIGGCEIDKRFADFYANKFSPRHMIVDDARVLLEKDFDFLYGLDVLDGSPPCTLFSIANIKAKERQGKLRKFKEGQKEQILDELLSVYARIVLKYRPKYFVMENVPGLIFGSNIKYLREFFDILHRDYSTEWGLLNSADLGLPQSRLRLFVLGKLNGGLASELLYFKKQKHVPFSEIEDPEDLTEENKDTKGYSIWKECKPGKNFESVTGSGWFNHYRVAKNKPLPTMTVGNRFYHYKIFRYINEKETCRAFGLEDDYCGELGPKNLGYIVPPIFYEKLVPRLLNW